MRGSGRNSPGLLGDFFAGLDGWRRSRTDYLEDARLLDRASYADPPGLCRRLRIWASDDARRYRERAEARPAEHAARLEKLGNFDPGSSRGYIPWADFARNQTLIADNANGKTFMSRGSVRRGEALLVGLFRCARCGRKLRVRYSDGSARYQCNGAFSHLAAALCISFSGMRVDRMVAKEVLDRLQPLGVEAALATIHARSHRRSEKQGQLEFALQQARYEAVRAQRQYDATDPDNRLVAGELERRWNERLVVVRNLETELEKLSAEREDALTIADRDRLMTLGGDLAQAWDRQAPQAPPRQQG